MPKKTRHIIQEVVDRERANFFRKRVAKKKPVYRTKRTEDNREIERLNQLVADLRTEINFLQPCIYAEMLSFDSFNYSTKIVN